MRYEESKEKYQGVFIAAPTPMHDDESLDLPRMRELIRHYRDAGLRTGNCVCTVIGAGGEAMHLDDDERRQVAETAVEAAEGQIPIFVGVGHTRTHCAVELARHADRIGADGLQLELPYYFDNTPDDAFAYISEVANAVECGIGLYPTAWASGLQFEASLIRRICDTLPNVVGLKWSHAVVHKWLRNSRIAFRSLRTSA
jgi:dihydrodipicolinate synthase/N-acetylneuraminate lyase